MEKLSMVFVVDKVCFPLLSCTHLIVVIIRVEITYRIRPSLALVVDLVLNSNMNKVIPIIQYP